MKSDNTTSSISDIKTLQKVTKKDKDRLNNVQRRITYVLHWDGVYRRKVGCQMNKIRLNKQRNYFFINIRHSYYNKKLIHPIYRLMNLQSYGLGKSKLAKLFF